MFKVNWCTFVQQEITKNPPTQVDGSNDKVMILLFVV